nr:unnamed protein product [Callosobruchus analis]
MLASAASTFTKHRQSLAKDAAIDSLAVEVCFIADALRTTEDIASASDLHKPKLDSIVDELTAILAGDKPLPSSKSRRGNIPNARRKPRGSKDRMRRQQYATVQSLWAEDPKLLATMVAEDTLADIDKRRQPELPKGDQNTCDRGYTTKSGLAKHSKTCGQRDRSTCQHCGKIFEMFCGLGLHELRAHTTEYNEELRGGQRRPGYTDEEFLTELFNQNPALRAELSDDQKDSNRIVGKRPCRNVRRETWFLEAEPATFKKIVKRGTVYFDLETVFVKEPVEALMCFKCCRFDHMAKGCKETADICYICGGEGHTGATCSNEWDCVNYDLDDQREVETEEFGNLKECMESGKGSRLENGIGIVHFNIRSLQKHFDELLMYVEDGKNIFDIIVLSETGNIDVSNFQIHNYTAYYNNSILNKCDGTVVYIKNSIASSVQTIEIHATKFLRIELSTNCFLRNFKIGITANYRPPSTSLKEYLKDLEQYFESIKKQDLEVFLGDININLFKKDLNETNLYVNILNAYGFLSYINKPTRVTLNSSSILDHIFISQSSNIQNRIKISPAVLQTDLTDHYTTFAYVNSKTQINTIQENNKKVIKKLNFQKLRNLFCNEQWVNVLQNNDVQEAYDIFLRKLNQNIDECTVRQTELRKYRKLKPWISLSLITSIHKRDEMKRKLIKYPTPELEVQYKFYRNKLDSLLRRAKNNFYKSKLGGSEGNCKKVWNVVKEITGNTKKSQITNTDILDAGGSKICSNKEKANLFNNFYTKLGTRMAEKIEKINLPKGFLKDPSIQASLFLTPTTTTELTVLISELKINSAPGPDNISVDIIRNIHAEIIDPLTHIINLCIQKGKIPSQWKESVVTPIYKSGDRNKLGNYRPISLINNFAKLFEKVIKKRLLEFLTVHKVMSESQFGFIPKSNTENAAFHLLQPIIEATDRSTKCLAVFLDLAKAFDTVSHLILLEKMQSYGIRGLALDLITDYLKNRTQSVKIGDHISTRLPVEIGVPQGTVLGPVLFLIYINSLTKINSFEGNIVCYADDTALAFTGQSWDDVHKTTEINLRMVKIWLDHNLLTLNTEKTKFITFSPTITDQPNIKVQLHSPNCSKANCDCPHLGKTSVIKYLGVMIDQHIRWNEHITHVTNRLRALIHQFYNVRNILSKKNLLMIYNSSGVSTEVLHSNLGRNFCVNAMFASNHSKYSIKNNILQRQTILN